MATETRRVSRAFLEAGVVSPNTKSNSLIMLSALGRAMSSGNFIQFGSLSKKLVDDCTIKVDALGRECFDRFTKVLRALNIDYVIDSDYVVLISLRLPVGPLKQWVDARTMEVIASDSRFTDEDVAEIPDRPKTVTSSQIRGWVMAILKDQRITSYFLANTAKDAKDMGAVFKITICNEGDRAVANQAFMEAGLVFSGCHTRKSVAVGSRFFFYEKPPDFDKLESVLPDWYKTKTTLSRRGRYRAQAIPAENSRSGRRIGARRRL